MAKQGGLAQAFFVGGYDLSGDVGSVQRCACPRAQLIVTGINKSAIERINGLADGLIEFSTWFNDAAGQEHAALKGLPTADVGVLYVNRSAAGAAAVGLIAKQVNYDWTRGADGSLQGTVQSVGQGFALEWGIMLSAGSVNQGAGASLASVDNGAATSNGIMVFLETMAVTGTANVIVEESSDNGVVDAWTAKVSINGVAARTHSRNTGTGTVERYLRITTTGGFTNLTFAVMARRGTAQDDTAL